MGIYWAVFTWTLGVLPVVCNCRSASYSFLQNESVTAVFTKGTRKNLLSWNCITIFIIWTCLLVRSDAVFGGHLL